MNNTQDIFQSDTAFLLFFSSLLIGIGFFFLILGLLCGLLPLSYCFESINPAFAFFPKAHQDFGLIGVPLLIIILGLSLRIFSSFGWWVSLGSLGFFFLFFCMQLTGLWRKMRIEIALIEATEQAPSHMTQLLYQSLVVDGFILVICVFAMTYLLLPIVKQLYFT